MKIISIIPGNIKLLFKVFVCKINKKKNFKISFPQQIAYETIVKIKQGKIIIGRKLTTKRNVYLSVVQGGTLEIGNNVFINQNCIFVCQKHISIGDGCMFGPNVSIYDHDHRFDDKKIYGDCKTGNIIIGKNCWIGTGAIILRNTTIGEGSVIAAGTVVKGNIPPHSIVSSDSKIKIVPIDKRIENR